MKIDFSLRTTKQITSRFVTIMVQAKDKQSTNKSNNIGVEIVVKLLVVKVLVA